MKKVDGRRGIVWVAQTALMLALLVVIQLISIGTAPFLGQIITGSLVNLVLIVGAGSVASAAAVAAILSPLLAFVMGKMPFVQMVLVVAVGNLIIVVITWLFFRGRNRISYGILADISGIVLGAIAKWLFLWGAVEWVVVPMFFAGNKNVADKLGLMFSWPQLVTALIGGVLSLFILPAVRSYRKKEYKM